jgi:hypothetical protein
MSEFTKLSVNVVPAAMQALNRAYERTGDSRTDVVNRALQIYDALLSMQVDQTVAFDEMTFARLR